MFKKVIVCIFIMQLVLVSCKDKKAATDMNESVKEDASAATKVSFVNDTVAQKVSVRINGKLFTNYVYDGKTPKPILYPIVTKSGKTVTRGFPYEPRAFERVDHPHHVGHWMNYGDVNGLDFWNNSYAIPAEEKHKYGTIHHQAISSLDPENGVLTVKAVWRSPNGNDLLEETTVFTFSEDGNTRTIKRSTTLSALENVSFTDNKEGMFAIRMARELELPTDKPAIFTDSQGNETTVAASNNEGAGGDYLASEGLTGNDVWGTRNRWVKLYGSIDEEAISVTILDHRENVGYPTYWHARDYGLFAANPLGQAVFSEGKETLNFKLQKSESVTFNYAMVIHNGSVLSNETIEAAFENFNR